MPSIEPTLDKLLLALSERPAPRPVSETTLAFLRKHGVAASLSKVLSRSSYAGPIRLGKLWFNEVNQITKENLARQNRPCIRNGFLIIGAGLNGDPIALELATQMVVFISHDLLWGNDFDSFSQCVAASPFDIHEFWRRAATDTTFPRDFYDARGDG
jgi:hypothetical protein